MQHRYSFLYLIVGMMCGISLMWLNQEKELNITDDQLDILSQTISDNITLKLSASNENNASYEFSSELQNRDSTDMELINKIKDEVSYIVTNELREHREISLSLTHTSKTKPASEKDYDSYHKSQLLLNDIVNGQQMSFQQFASDPDVLNLPTELKNRILGEVAMKLNSGELNADTFIGK